MASLVNVNVLWWGLALVLSVLANLLCAKRWAMTSSMLELPGQPYGRYVRWYAQGIAVNSVVPGGLLGGDALRSFRQQPIAKGASSVMLERLVGLWALCILSATVWLFAPDLVGNARQSRGVSEPLFSSYAALLMIAALSPFAAHRLWRLLPALKTRLPLPPIRRLISLLPISLAAQFLTAACLWICLIAIGVQMHLGNLIAVTAGIFLASIVPASLGGFGAREVASVFFLGWLGIEASQALAASLLFGLCTTAQGLGSMTWLSLTDDPKRMRQH